MSRLRKTAEPGRLLLGLLFQVARNARCQQTSVNFHSGLDNYNGT